jgi:hypothetical protein
VQLPPTGTQQVLVTQERLWVPWQQSLIMVQELFNPPQHMPFVQVRLVSQQGSVVVQAVLVRAQTLHMPPEHVRPWQHWSVLVHDVFNPLHEVVVEPPLPPEPPGPVPVVSPWVKVVPVWEPSMSWLGPPGSP